MLRIYLNPNDGEEPTGRLKEMCPVIVSNDPNLESIGVKIIFVDENNRPFQIPYVESTLTPPTTVRETLSLFFPDYVFVTSAWRIDTTPQGAASTAVIHICNKEWKAKEKVDVASIRKAQREVAVAKKRVELENKSKEDIIPVVQVGEKVTMQESAPATPVTKERGITLVTK